MSFIRQHKFLSALLLVISVFILSVITLIIFAEPIIRSLTESKGGEKLGREFAIDGPLKIDWRWRNTKIHAEKIAPWKCGRICGTEYGD